MITFCDSCTEEKEIKSYLYTEIIFYWCEDCKDEEGVLVNA